MKDDYVNYVNKFEPLWKEWTVDSLIGKGGFGSVYKISRTESGKKIYAALKHVHIEQSDFYSSEIKRSIEEEISLLCRFKDNPNIVSIDDYSIIEDTSTQSADVFIRMELLTPLYTYIASHGFSERDVLKLGIDITSALVSLHNESVLHRDINPSNIFVNNANQFKLGDFGTSLDFSETQTRLVVGTLLYIAPEFLQGIYTASADLYSLGLVLYQFLNNNQLPFVSENAISYSEAHEYRMKGNPLPPPSNASKEFARIILKATSYDPQKRFQNAKEFLNALIGVKTTSQEPLRFFTSTKTGPARLDVTRDLDAPASKPKQNAESQQDFVKSNARDFFGATGEAKNFNSDGGMSSRVGSTGDGNGNNSPKEARNRRHSVLKKLLYWFVFTVLISLIPSLIYFPLRWLFDITLPYESRLTADLLYLVLALCVVALRELIFFDATKKDSTPFHLSLFSVVVCLIISAILLSIITAIELGIITKAASSSSILAASVLLSIFCFVIGIIIQVWGAL